jgi:hypothetical protein
MREGRKTKGPNSAKSTPQKPKLDPSLEEAKVESSNVSE